MDGRYLSMQQAYRLDPYDRLYAHEREKVIGVQANVWAEFIPDFGRVQFALLPRLAAICETAWAYDRKVSLNDFVVKAKAILPGVYQSYGYHYAPYFFEGID